MKKTARGERHLRVGSTGRIDSSGRRHTRPSQQSADVAQGRRSHEGPVESEHPAIVAGTDPVASTAHSSSSDLVVIRRPMEASRLWGCRAAMRHGTWWATTIKRLSSLTESSDG